MKDKGNILVTGHILIRDIETKEILVNKSEYSDISIHDIKKIKDLNDEK